MTTAQFVLLMRTWALLLTFFLVGPFLSAQEICSNGIDDDGDGLIDLNDKENCSCALSSTLTSLLPNPSLENFDSGQVGCTSSQPGGRPDAVNQANCLTGWKRASLGTTDSWNAFTLTGAGPFFPKKLPLPLPSGTGVAGFWVGVKDTPDASFTNGDGTRTKQYREYLAACLVDGQRMEPGKPYHLTFSLGFMEPQTAHDDSTVVDIRSPESVELSIYGVRECGQLNFGAFYGCPEASDAFGYELIANVTVNGTAGSWTFQEVDFVSQGSYAGFAIGGSCAADNTRPDGGNYRNYYFIDELILNEPAAFAEPVAGPVAVDGLTACDEVITLSGQARTGATYQWFRNGIAVAGATAPALEIAGGPSADGTYVLRVSTAAGCALTEPVVIQRPVVSDHFAETAAICTGEDSVELSPRRFSGATFRWSDGSTGSSLTVARPGTYAVTVNESCVEHVEEITVKKELPFTYTVTQEPEMACIGDSVTIQVSSNAFDPRYYFRNLETGAPIQTENGSIRLVAGEVEEIMAFLGNDCGLETHIIRIAAAQPFELLGAEVTDVTCPSGAGQIVLSVAGDESARYNWRDARGEAVGDGTSVLNVTQGGTYTVTVSDPAHCPLTLSYTVEETPPVRASLEVTAPNCTGNGSITIANVSGTAPFRYRWYRNGNPDPIQENINSRTKLSAGSYAIEITDARGCSYRETVVLEGSEPLTVETTASFADCEDPLSGKIEVRPAGGVYPYRYELAGYPAQSSPTFTGLPAGTYRLRVEDAGGCTSEAQIVTLEGLPDLDLGADHRIRPGDSVTLAPIDAPLYAFEGSFDWYPNAASLHEGSTVKVAPSESTEYRLSYTTAQGCQTTDYVMVHVEEDPRVYVPNAFSPNGDGNNDRFEVYLGSGVQSLTNLMVFDRWGELVWKKTDDTAESWDGTYRGKPLTSGVFAYVGQVRLDNGTLIPLKGSVTIIE